MRNVWRGLAVLSALCACAVAVGCNPRDAQNITQDTRHLAQDTGQALGEVGLSAKVYTVLAAQKGVDVKGIHVDAQNGVVTLGGHVRSAQERKKVVNAVEDIRGVDKVVNNLRVQP